MTGAPGFAPAIADAIATLDRAFAAPAAPVRRSGLLVRDPAEADCRYLMVPAEAFPFLDQGLDGCHYALWIDDPARDVAPPVVAVWPMDPVPETVQLVASSATDLVALVAAVGAVPGAGAGVVADLHRARARASRARDVRYRTADGLGVVAPPETDAPRPDPGELAGWARARDGAALRRAVDRWLAGGTPGLALAVCRDLIATGDASAILGFAGACADVYRALGRDRLAAIAAAAYA